MTPLKIFGITLAAATALTAPAMAQYGHRGGEAMAIVYQHSDFRGNSIRVTGAVNDLSRYRFNDKASSIRVTGGAWEVCVHANYRGRCEVISYREGELNDYRLNDKISSIRPVAYGGGRHDRYDRDDQYRGHDRRDDYARGGYQRGANAPVVLFQHSEYRGAALPVDGAIANLGQARFNDKVSSIAVNNGAWEVCTDANFRGRCEIVQGSVSETGYYRLNDNISSIRPASRHYGVRW